MSLQSYNRLEEGLMPSKLSFPSVFLFIALSLTVLSLVRRFGQKRLLND